MSRIIDEMTTKEIVDVLAKERYRTLYLGGVRDVDDKNGSIDTLFHGEKMELVGIAEIALDEFRAKIVGGEV